MLLAMIPTSADLRPTHPTKAFPGERLLKQMAD